MKPDQTLKAVMKALDRGDHGIAEMMCESILEHYPNSSEAGEAKQILRKLSGNDEPEQEAAPPMEEALSSENHSKKENRLVLVVVGLLLTCLIIAIGLGSRDKPFTEDETSWQDAAKELESLPLEERLKKKYNIQSSADDVLTDSCISQIQKRAQRACDTDAKAFACGILNMDNIGAEYSCRENWMLKSSEARSKMCKDAVSKIVHTAIDEGRC